MNESLFKLGSFDQHTCKEFNLLDKVVTKQRVYQERANLIQEQKVQCNCLCGDKKN